MRRITLVAAVIALALAATAASAQGPSIGAGTPCSASWTAPTTHTDGTPLAAGELLQYNAYLDPPSTGVVAGVTPPTFVVAPVAPATVPPTTASICKSVTALAAGPHTITVSAVGTGGEGPAVTPAAPFVFVTAKPSSPSGPIQLR